VEGRQHSRPHDLEWLDLMDVADGDDDVLRPRVRQLGQPIDDLGCGLDTPAGRRRIRLDLLTDKAVARLMQIARGEAAAPPRGKGNAEKTKSETVDPMTPGLPEGARDSQGEGSS